MDYKQLRIIYMGTPAFAVAPLQRLVEAGCNIVAVVTVPDKPSGRGLHVQKSAVKLYAEEKGLPVLQPEKLSTPEFAETFNALHPDVAVVVAFRMLPEAIWSAPKLGTFNLHASLLPQYRGAAPINWAVINGETRTGVTTFFLDRQIDTGAIIAQRTVDILPQDDAGSLHDKLMAPGAGLVLDTVKLIAGGNAAPTAQTTSGALKPAPKIFKEDTLIDWRGNGNGIRNKIRGLSPYPAATGVMAPENGDEVPVKIFASHFEAAGHHYAPGTILSDGKTFLKAACADGFVFIDNLQPAGKKRLAAAEFLRGFRNIASYRFK